MDETKLHVIVIIETSVMSGLDNMLKSLFTDVKVVEIQLQGERCRILLCKTQNFSITRSPQLLSGDVLVTFISGFWLSC